jgi:biotin carboxylase
MPKIIIAINKVNPSAVASIQAMQGELGDVRVVILKDVRLRSRDLSQFSESGIALSEQEVDYFDAAQLTQKLVNLKEDIIGVISRGEGSIQYLARLSEVCREWGIAIPSRESLEISTDKQRMRARFQAAQPEISPAFLEVSDASPDTMEAIERQVGYPLVVKPANLASSLLIQKCESSDQLVEILPHTLEAIKEVYKSNGRYETPTLIVEQMLVGDLYSVDTYITSDGAMFHCPPVRYMSGQSLGVDDFFLYKRTAPVSLDDAEWQLCRTTVESAIRAIGLTATTAHVELCRTQNGWKIIEVGPRVGRYRVELYREVYDIDHSSNDVRVRLGMTPVISTIIQKHCAVYSIYPLEEGRLDVVAHASEVDQLPSLLYARRLIEDGMMVRHAKHGGHAIMEVILSHSDNDQFERDCQWLESHVKAVVVADTTI